MVFSRFGRKLAILISSRVCFSLAGSELSTIIRISYFFIIIASTKALHNQPN